MEKEAMIYFKNLFYQMQKNLTQIQDDDWGREENILAIRDEMDLVQEGRDEEFEKRLKSRSRLYLKKIDDAVIRIEKGSFGECQECKEEISFERLRARPTATLCIKCKEEEERILEHVPYERRSKGTGSGLAIVGSNCLDFSREDKNFSEGQVLKLAFDKGDD